MGYCWPCKCCEKQLPAPCYGRWDYEDEDFDDLTNYAAGFSNGIQKIGNNIVFPGPVNPFQEVDGRLEVERIAPIDFGIDDPERYKSDCKCQILMAMPVNEDFELHIECDLYTNGIYRSAVRLGNIVFYPTGVFSGDQPAIIRASYYQGQFSNNWFQSSVVVNNYEGGAGDGDDERWLRTHIMVRGDGEGGAEWYFVDPSGNEHRFAGMNTEEVKTQLGAQYGTCVDAGLDTFLGGKFDNLHIWSVGVKSPEQDPECPADGYFATHWYGEIEIVEEDEDSEDRWQKGTVSGYSKSGVARWVTDLGIHEETGRRRRAIYAHPGTDNDVYVMWDLPDPNTEVRGQRRRNTTPQVHDVEHDGPAGGVCRLKASTGEIVWTTEFENRLDFSTVSFRWRNAFYGSSKRHHLPNCAVFHTTIWCGGYIDENFGMFRHVDKEDGTILSTLNIGDIDCSVFGSTGDETEDQRVRLRLEIAFNYARTSFANTENSSNGPSWGLVENVAGHVVLGVQGCDGEGSYFHRHYAIKGPGSTIAHQLVSGVRNAGGHQSVTEAASGKMLVTFKQKSSITSPIAILYDPQQDFPLPSSPDALFKNQGVEYSYWDSAYVPPIAPQKIVMRHDLGRWQSADELSQPNAAVCASDKSGNITMLSSSPRIQLDVWRLTYISGAYIPKRPINTLSNNNDTWENINPLGIWGHYFTGVVNPDRLAYTNHGFVYSEFNYYGEYRSLQILPQNTPEADETLQTQGHYRGPYTDPNGVLWPVFHKFPPGNKMLGRTQSIPRINLEAGVLAVPRIGAGSAGAAYDTIEASLFYSGEFENAEVVETGGTYEVVDQDTGRSVWTRLKWACIIFCDHTLSEHVAYSTPIRHLEIPTGNGTVLRPEWKRAWDDGEQDDYVKNVEYYSVR